MDSQVAFEGFPLVVGWELTLACNIRCRHCASSAEKARERELSRTEAIHLCDQFPDLLVQEVDFTGGEALISPHWMEVAQHLKKLGITTRILSNGLLLNSENVARIRDSGIASVGISIDGLATNHDLIRNCSGLFDRVLRAVDHLGEVGIPVTVVTTINARNLGELAEVHRILKQHGVSAWQVQPLFPSGRCEKAEDLHLSCADYLEIETFLRHCPSAGESLEVRAADGLGYFAGADPTEGAWHGCPAGIAACGILSDGRVKGCLSLPDHLCEESVRDKDLWDIWFSPGGFSYSRGFEERKLGENCANCQHGSRCKGGCTVMSYASTGRFHNDPYCFHRLREGPPRPGSQRQSW